MSNDTDKNTTDSVESSPLFRDLNLSDFVIQALDAVGYEKPTPIQAQTIPLLIEGRDVLGQAQTGTGKTAAFALPILSEIDLKQKHPQALILAPTRELAIQVAEALQKYATHLKGFHVLPIYGGQSYDGQLRSLKRGVHVVVGTPGRVMDHMRRGTLKLAELKTLVLDEADEMLRMGFIDDVEWILEQTPEQRQIALFSATMPTQIRKLTNKYLNNPEHVTIKVKTATASTIRQRYWPVRGFRKLDALTRILEAETYDGMIIFVRTKIATVELAEKLEARGHSVAALNGDIAQAQRERIVNQLKKGRIDILVATDVVARGLDVERISHVFNYDIPHDPESYVHRIGRTGRAGRTGDAILFVQPRERRMLSSIERATKSKIEIMELPTTKEINQSRIERLKQQISVTLEKGKLDFFTQLIEEYIAENETDSLKVAAALAQLMQGEEPFLLDNRPEPKRASKDWANEGNNRNDRSRGRGRERGDRERGRNRGDREQGRGRERRPGNDKVFDSPKEEGMDRYRLAVGRAHEVRPGNVVGAIANEAGLTNKQIGKIDIYDSFTLVDLPEGMPKDVLKDLKNVWVSGRQLNIALYDKDAHDSENPGDKKPRRRSEGKPFHRGKSKDKKFAEKRISKKGKKSSSGKSKKKSEAKKETKPRRAKPKSTAQSKPKAKSKPKGKSKPKAKAKK